MSQKAKNMVKEQGFPGKKDQLLKIGVFYDGNYFFHVSNFYNYEHPRRKRISVDGIHSFIRQKASEFEQVPIHFSQIVDAHYFRGRLSAQEANSRGDTLFWDRVFDDILMSSGVATHYLPLKNVGGRKEEKGIDVWLALEAFEQAFYKRFDVLCLIACDGDYLPLVRKLNSIGTRVMVLGWDFEYTLDNRRKMVTRTSLDLMKEASYPIRMHTLIDTPKNIKDPVINDLFVSNEGNKPQARHFLKADEYKKSEILKLKNGYGFIKYPELNNLFFHHTYVVNGDFNDLKEGDKVLFSISRNEEEEPIAINVSPLPK